MMGRLVFSQYFGNFWSQFNPLKCRTARRMNLKAIVYLSLFLFGSAVKAETKYLLVDPGASKTANYYRYYNDVRRAYETLKSQNKPTTVIGKDGTWKLAQQDTESLSSFALTESGKRNTPSSSAVPVYPPLSGSARGISDIMGSMDKMNLKPGDTVFLYLTAHGGPPSNVADPSTATVVGWNEEFEFNQLAEALKKLPPGVKVKLVSTTCFSGGIHSIARQLPNVCSSSTTNHLYESSSGDFQEFRFNRGLWDAFRKNKQVSFAEANLEAFKADDANMNLGRLSSFDYIDWTLKTGPYKNPKVDTPSRWTDTDNGRTWQTINKYRGVFPADAEILSKKVDTSSCSSSVQNDLANLTRLTETLNELSQQAIAQDLKNRANRQPAQMRTIFNDVIDDMKKNGPKYLQISNQYQQKYKELMARWNAHKAKFKDSWGITKWWYGEGDERAKIQKEFDVLKANSQRDLKQYSFNHQMLERLDRLDEFNKKATPAQKQKFVSLLQCEWEPL